MSLSMTDRPILGKKKKGKPYVYNNKKKNKKKNKQIPRPENFTMSLSMTDRPILGKKKKERKKLLRI